MKTLSLTIIVVVGLGVATGLVGYSTRIDTTELNKVMQVNNAAVLSILENETTAEINGAFGITFGTKYQPVRKVPPTENLSAMVKYLNEYTPETTKYSVIPPISNSSFYDYSVEVTPISRVIYYISASAGCNATEKMFEKMDVILKALNLKYNTSAKWITDRTSSYATINGKNGSITLSIVQASYDMGRENSLGFISYTSDSKINGNELALVKADKIIKTNTNGL